MIRDLSNIDTTPGAGWAAPAAEVDEYTAWLRARFVACPAVKQYMVVTAWLLTAGSVKVTGPYADEFRAAVSAMRTAPRPRAPESKPAGRPTRRRA